jgi:signal transduction histidine kinase
VSSGIDHATAATVPSSARSRLAARITQWRHWRLGVKLAAVVLVPMIFAAIASIVQIEDLTVEANGYTQLDGVVRTADSVRTIAADLQDERSAATEFLAGGSISRPALQQRFALSEHAARSPAFRRSRGADEVRAAHDEAANQLSPIPALRNQILTRQVNPLAAANTYTAAIGALLDLDRTLVGQMSSLPLSSTATTLHELARVGEEVRLQQALMLPGLLTHNFPLPVRAALGDSETRRLAALGELRASAAPQQRAYYDSLFTSADFMAHETALHRVLISRDDPAGPPVVDTGTWAAQAHSVLDAISAEQARLDGQLRDTAFVLQDHASNMAGAEAAIFLSALMITSAIVIVVTRQLLGSLDALRRSALDTANTQLPLAVRSLRVGSKATIERVPVDTGEEIGEVARAFDAVHTQAIHLASEQAELRKSFRDSFVNVSRRSQSLLERQLRLFEQLERDEEDPDQLSTLFQLDHLATRMRRNNENLMVLSGADLARRFSKPTSPADLLRAAVSEIEHYPRVIIQPLPDVTITGSAASDMVRLLAELLDNATSFSAPHSKVTVSGHRRGDGSLGIDIVDRGIGMGEPELADANRRLATDGGIELSTSRRLGLFVAGRLAARHGIGVELHPGADKIGIRAAVTLAADLLVRPVAPPSGTQTNGFAQERQTPSTPTRKLASEARTEDAGQTAGTRNGFHLLAAPATAGDGAADQEPTDRTQGLFVAEKQPGSSPESGVPENRVTDAPTPIFDDLASSAWFRISRSPKQAYPDPADQAVRWPARPADEPDRAPEPGPASETRCSPPPPAARNNTRPEAPSPTMNGNHTGPVTAPQTGAAAEWTFRSDNARRHAEEISMATPADFTPAGLPRRTPQAHLLAGNAQSDVDAPRGYRDPELTRGRLSSFQQGVQRGRNSKNNIRHPDAPPAPPTKSTMDDVDPWRPSEWNLSFDSPPHSTPQQHTASFDYTYAGLPRRTPRTQWIPAAPDRPESRATPRRDATSVRGRLTSFQRGVREGKHHHRHPEGGLPREPW